jgi:phosphoglycolate phosphatase-like HAD superfamily hydrolase
MRRMIKALIFDFDGTLVDFVESDIASLKYLYRLTGMNQIIKLIILKSLEYY